MYGEPFTVPEPMETVFISWYDGGEVFRSGAHLPARRRPHLLFLARATRSIRSTTTRTFGRCCGTPSNGPTTRRRPGATSQWRPTSPVDKAPEQITERGPRLHEAGEAGFAEGGAMIKTSHPRHRQHGRQPCRRLRRRDGRRARRGGRAERGAARKAFTEGAQDPASASPTSTRRSPGASSTPRPT